jgi:DNA polymerase sigma
MACYWKRSLNKCSKELELLSKHVHQRHLLVCHQHLYNVNCLTSQHTGGLTSSQVIILQVMLTSFFSTFCQDRFLSTTVQRDNVKNFSWVPDDEYIPNGVNGDVPSAQTYCPNFLEFNTV